MYGDGNSSRMVGDIISSTTRVTDGLSEATGVDIRGILSSFLGGRAVSAPASEEPVKSEKDDEPFDAEKFMEEILPADTADTSSDFEDTDSRH